MDPPLALSAARSSCALVMSASLEVSFIFSEATSALWPSKAACMFSFSDLTSAMARAKSVAWSTAPLRHFF